MNKLNENTHIIKLTGDSGRLDKVLTSQFPDESRSTIQKLIKDQWVTVNEKVEKANFKLVGDETIHVTFQEEQPLELVAEDIPLDIVFEDDDLIVINKPAGMVVHPSKGHASGTLVNALLHYLGNNLSDTAEAIRPGIVHRIDKDTSGLLVVAKNNYAHQKLSEQLTDHTMGRQYVALVLGTIEPEEATIEIPIRRDPNSRMRWRADKDGKYALTTFEVMTRYSESTLLQLELKTGRTHQIRVHLEHIGHPIVGDPIYRVGMNQFKTPLAKNKDGQLLHAQSLHFYHPRSNELVEFSTQLPTYFTEVLDTLEKI